MKTKSSYLNKIENSLFVTIIRNSVISLFPVIIFGAFALVLTSLPIKGYQEFVKEAFNGYLYNALSLIYESTYGMLSVYTAILIGYNYATYHTDSNAKQVGTSLSSLLAYLISVGFLSDSFEMPSLSAQGMFIAIFCGYISSYIFCFFHNKINIKLYTDGSSVYFNNAVSSIFPLLIDGVVFALVTLFISAVSPYSNAYLLIKNLFNSAFSSLGSNFGGGFVYVLVLSLLWSFGIHGSNMLESVNQGMLADSMAKNIENINSGLAPTEIYTKTFFDVFVLMGGCGTLISLLISILIFSKRRNTRSVAKISALPMFFNINELMVFGLPIIYNPILIVPFILSPIIAFSIASVFTATGLVPITVNTVEWTTPVLIGGYEATGSIRGSMLQFLIIAVCVLIYAPFVKYYDLVKEEESKEKINSLVSLIKNSEKTKKPITLTELKGEAGIISKQLVVDLKDAILNNEIKIFYQPQYDYRNELMGLEALVRWNHKLLGYIYPPLIIKIAEESNQISNLEKYIFNTVYEDSKELNVKKICINMSSESINNTDFLEYINENKKKVNPGTDICIEITERSPLINDNNSVKAFDNLKSNGFLLAIDDDFSMGSTSLNYLSNYKFNIVKIDGSLVRNLDNLRNKEIISSIIYLSKSLYFSVIAEFVETQQQIDLLHNIGCDIYQGYYFSQAKPKEEILAQIKTKQKMHLG